MSELFEAWFDGSVFRPTERIALTPNTRVRMSIDSVIPTAGSAYSFLHTAQSLDLDGPPDWAENVDEYLYGGKESHAE
jgi:hypothetical protein